MSSLPKGLNQSKSIKASKGKVGKETPGEEIIHGGMGICFKVASYVGSTTEGDAVKGQVGQGGAKYYRQDPVKGAMVEDGNYHG